MAGNRLLGQSGFNALVPLQDQQDAALPAGDAGGYGSVLDAIQQQRAQSMAMGLLDPKTGLPTAAGWRQAANQYANGLLMGSTAPQGNGLLAYHGSPHDFDAFSLDKIGTGEGAQAYGHGLYFAQNEGVARSYRDNLSPVEYQGAPLTLHPSDSPQARAIHSVAVQVSKGADPAAAIADELNGWSGHIESYKQYLSDPDPAVRQGVQEEIDNTQPIVDTLKQLQPEHFAKNGRMYEVNLNVQPHELLDWDKPRDQLSPLVQEWAQKNYPEAWDGAADGASLYRLISKAEGLKGTAPGNPDPTYYSQDPAAASAAMRNAGIKGIRYLDQGSRGAGDGTSNLVVFSPDTIQILRKYGLAGLGLGGAAAAASPDQSDPGAQQ